MGTPNALSLPEVTNAFYDCGDPAGAVAARSRQRLYARQFHLRAARDRARVVRCRSRQRSPYGLAAESAKLLATGQRLGCVPRPFSLEIIRNRPDSVGFLRHGRCSAFQLESRQRCRELIAPSEQCLARTPRPTCTLTGTCTD